MSAAIEERLNREKRLTYTKGALYLVASIGFMALAWFFYQQDVQVSEDNVYSELQARCMASARRAGFNVSVNGKNVAVLLRQQGISSRDVVMQSSLVIEGCDGYKIADYCYGEECGSDNFKMMLRPADPKV